MLMNLEMFGIPLMVIGLFLLLYGARRRHLDSVSIGGFLLGGSIMLIGFQEFFVFQHHDETFEYFGSASTEFLMGLMLAIGLFLAALSLFGWARKRFFWQYLVGSSHS